MNIKLVCRDENKTDITKLLIASCIDIDDAAEVVMVEEGLEHSVESEIKIVFTKSAFPALISFLKSSESYLSPVGIITGKINEVFYPISIENIVYINAINNEVFIHDTQRNQYAVKHKLYQLEHTMLPEYFIRINKSEIVNIKRIQTIAPMFKGKLILYMEGYKNPLDISRNNTRAFKERLGML